MSTNEDSWHECLLWGNAAFIKAEQLARAFAEKHWNMNPADASQTDNLPMYYYEDDGDTLLMPCAEIFLTEKGGYKLSKEGLMALWSVKNMDAIRSSDFNSLSSGSRVLQGRWVT
jgi:predicted component of type VI protein secretion system